MFASKFKKSITKAQSLIAYDSSKFIELQKIRENLKLLSISKNLKLLEITKNLFNDGKMLRPMLVLLMSRATLQSNLSSPSLNTPLSKLGQEYDQSVEYPNGDCQTRLAEITEMIHVASLLHDDVIDEARDRRGSLSVNALVGNKMAILAGDYLLSRASVSLSRLHNLKVVELLSTVIANLVEGEFMQLTNSGSLEGFPSHLPSTFGGNDLESNDGFKYYLQKTYLKTASLMAKSCAASAVLNGSGEREERIAYEFGRNFGIAFQITDDLLDFTSTSSILGKPVNADLKLGLATGPVLYAMQVYPELEGLAKRQFKGDGDVDLVREKVLSSGGIEKCKLLAEEFSTEARRVIQDLKKSPARDALEELTFTVLSRQK